MKDKKKHILAVNFGGIGDEILFFPTLKTIKNSYPDQPHITLVVEPRSASSGKLTNLVDDIITCDIKGKNKYSEIIKLLFKVWNRKYDVVFSSGGSTVVSVLLLLMGIKERIGYNSGRLSQILLTRAVSLKKQQYAGDMYHDLAKAVFPDAVAELPEVDVSEENINWAREKIGTKNKPVIVIHPGVSQMSIRKNIIKFWPAENWIELIMKLVDSDRYKVVLVGGPDDKAIFDKLKDQLAECNVSQNKLIDLYGKTQNIQQLAALVKVSDLIVCVDSAPMHIGVGVNTPTIAIFGPTDENKLLPIKNPNFIAIKNDCECRPCLWDKRQVSCEKLDCLKIPAKQVLNEIEKLLQENLRVLNK